MMKYIPLFKIYYTTPEKWNSIREERYAFEFSTRLPFEIKEWGHKISYPAFFCYTSDMVKQVENLKSASSDFSQLIPSLPPILYKNLSDMFIMEEIKASNQIEGIHSSRKELKETLLYLNEKDNLRFHNIAMKYTHLLYGTPISFKTPSQIRQFCNEFICDEIKKSDRPDGKIFRASPVEITTATGKILHHGLSPEKAIISAMKTALALLHDSQIPAMIRIAIFHYLFGYIHPFYDGNGRTSRFISSYYLSKQIHPLVALRLSVMIKNHVTTYYKMFQRTNAEINGGDLTFFILSFLQYIESALKETRRILEGRKARLYRYETQLRQFLDQNHIDDPLVQDIYLLLLQARLFSFAPGITKKDLMGKLKKSRGTIDQRFSAIPASHYHISQMGHAHAFSLNLDILRK